MRIPGVKGELADDLSGRRFGLLVVDERVGTTEDSKALWRCRCDCGGESVVRGCYLRSGHTKSCGCQKGRRNGEAAATTHGMSGTPTYGTWRKMIERCTNPNARQWEWYGGRGVTVCDRWRSFENFLADMGERPEGRTLDRVDVNGNYEPGNCRWATWPEQCANKRPKRWWRRPEEGAAA